MIDSPIISYQEQSITTDGIGENDSIYVTFVVTVSNSAPFGAILDDYMTVTSNGYQDIYQNSISLGNCIENFENDDLNSNFSWNNSGACPWFKDDNNPYEGSYCYTGPSSSTGTISKLAIAVTTEIDDKVSFYYKGSINSNDEFKFYLNTESFTLTGSQWQLFEQPLPIGIHLLRWTFSRKSHADEGSASIDLIKLPPMHVEITDIEEFTEKTNIVTVYPNPGNNELNIITSENNFSKLQVFDFQGKIVFEKEIDSEIMTINTQNWASGLYFWKVGNDAGKWIKLK